MSLKQSYSRYRIVFEKTGVARFIGHLDLQSFFQRAIKRAKLPVAYSEGFNPHQLLSFAAPLPLGVAGYKEILEVFLVHEVPAAEISRELNLQMPTGLRVTGVQEVPAVGKSAAALVCNATYSIIFSEIENLSSSVKRVNESGSIVVNKKSKKGVTSVDIKPDIHELEMVSECSLQVVLACGSERNLKPEVLAQHILLESEIASENCDVIYERLEVGLR